MASSHALQAIIYRRGHLQLLDQRQLPFDMTYLPVQNPQDAWQHIRDMVVRGAPAIGVTAALALAVDLCVNKQAGEAFPDAQAAVTYIRDACDYLVTSRPTAVNLADAVVKLKSTAISAGASAGATSASVVEAVTVAAEKYFEDDLLANKALGAHGATALLSAVAASGSSRGSSGGGGLRVLTHCNTGSLATAGYGTALGVIRALHEQGKLEHAFCTETRPYNQGARLTAFELVHDELPATLVVDSSVSALMASGRVDAVVVGADRVVANGDTANKIGTMMLAISAHHFKIPFFIAAPTTTLDPALPDGSHIEIEQRGPEEVTHFRGVQVVKAGIKVWNPAFDVAPASLITGIITERGMVPKQGDVFQVPAFCQQLSTSAAEQAAAPASNGHAASPLAVMSATAAAAESPSASPAAFLTLDTARVVEYVAERPALRERVGPAESTASWRVREVGDGNINFVYIVEGPTGALCIKQALPYVRCVGESWPLSQERARIEAEALIAEASLVPQHVPAVHLYDAANFIIVMHYLPPPFIILRRGIIAGNSYPHLAQHTAEFLAQTLFHSSLIKLDVETFRQRVAQYSNQICRLTEQVVFLEPYTAAANNRWTTPQLDADVASLHADVEAKVAICGLRAKFMQNTEALLHGDLHTGSLMVTEAETFMIDPEFAFYGPMAFDIAKMLGELLLAAFATTGHTEQGGRPEQRAWILSAVRDTWVLFSARFLELWNTQGRTGGLSTLYPQQLLGDAAPAGPASLAACQRQFMGQLWEDTVAFSGCVMLRRLVGISHTADLDSISDADVRAGCERRALRFARWLLVVPTAFATVDALVAGAATAITA